MRKITIPMAIFIAVGFFCSYAYAQSFDLWSCVSTIKLAESSGCDAAVGDDGKSLGGYQIKESTWKKYSRLPWRTYAQNPKESRIVAGMIVSDIIRHCKKYHAEEFATRPYAIVAMHYNAGINTRLSVDRWQKKTTNKIYRSIR